MSKRFWIPSLGAVVVATIAITANLAGAAPGDAVWVAPPTEWVSLTLPQRTAVGTAVNAAFGVAAGNVDAENCKRTKDLFAEWMGCRVFGEVTLTDEEYLDADLAGELHNPQTGTTIKQRPDKGEPPLTLDGADLTNHDAVTEAIWSKDIADVYRLQVRRDPPNSECSGVCARYWEIKTGTPTEYRAARTAGEVALVLSKATE